MQNYQVSDQYAANSVTEKPAMTDTDVPVIESALAHTNMKTLAARTFSGQGVTLTELPVVGLLLVPVYSVDSAR